MSEPIILDNGLLRAAIAPRGAELVSLATPWGGEFLWSGDPAVWPWHAPNLFPIVGALADDTLNHRGRAYPMKQHGFLRLSDCAIVAADARECALRLVDTTETRRHYPFAFALTLHFRLEGDRLEQSFELANPGAEPLPASLGAHPAFRWPLAPGTARDACWVRFEQDEPTPIRRLDGRGLGGERPSPVAGRLLALTDELFTEDALIFDHLRSRRVVFGADAGAGIELSFADFPHFGLWSKPGAGFLCLEPWQGYASPVGFTGDFAQKPGIVTLPPGTTRRWRLSIRPLRNANEESR
jgi:galactose mutarotase-like enzyme